MKFKSISLGFIFYIFGNYLTTPISSQSLSYINQDGSDNWDYFDKELRKMSSFFGHPNDQFIKQSKLANIQKQGNKVKFIYDCGDNHGDEVVFTIQDKGSINLKEWKQDSFAKLMTKLNDKKIKKSNDITQVPLALATEKDFQSKNFLKKAQNQHTFHIMTTQQMVKDPLLPKIKNHIVQTADITLSKTNLLEIQKKRDDQNSFSYRCTFNTVKKTSPQKGVFRFIIIVSIDTDNNETQTVDDEYHQINQIPVIHQKSSQNQEDSKYKVKENKPKKQKEQKQAEELTIVEQKQEVSTSHHYPVNLGQAFVQQLLKRGKDVTESQKKAFNQKILNQNKQKQAARSQSALIVKKDQKNLKVASEKQQKIQTISQTKLEEQRKRRFFSKDCAQGICLINKINGDCQKCSYRSIPIGKKCLQVQQKCNKFDDSTGQCFECYNGYFLNNGICKKNNDLCATCDNQGKCTSCFKNFILINGNCIVQSKNTNNLKKQSSSQAYFKPPIDPLCIKTQQGKCIQCFAGAYLSKQNICKIVDPNCQKFDQEKQICNICSRGYDNINGLCQRSTKRW